MKKISLILLIAVISLAAVISFGCGSSGLNGTYEGILPCADCPGLETIITFNPDGTYHMEETYIESDVDTIITDGTWTLEGEIITCAAGDYEFEYKLISEKEIKWAPDSEEITETDLNWSLLKK